MPTPKPGTNRKVVNDEGILNLSESEECLYPGNDRDQLSIYCPINSPEPHDLEMFKPNIDKALRDWAAKHCPEFLVIIYPEGYDQALVYEINDEEDAENDVAYTVFLGKQVVENKDGKDITLDDLEDVEDIDQLLKDEESLFIYRAEKGNMREVIISQATVLAEKNLERNPDIL